jgi:hypothetical protein
MTDRCVYLTTLFYVPACVPQEWNSYFAVDLRLVHCGQTCCAIGVLEKCSRSHA